MLARLLSADRTTRSSRALELFFANITEREKEIINRVKKIAEEKK
jgi:single-stranded DNA-specific DHH superfamily exonuclease